MEKILKSTNVILINSIMMLKRFDSEKNVLILSLSEMEKKVSADILHLIRKSTTDKIHNAIFNFYIGKRGSFYEQVL